VQLGKELNRFSHRILRWSFLSSLNRSALIFIGLIAVVVVAAVSFAVPSIPTPSQTTQESSSVITSVTSYTSEFSESASTVVLAAQTTSTIWYQGNALCDPASMACTPQAFPTATVTYTGWSTYPYEITIYSQVQSTYTTESVTFATQTSYQTVAPYVAIGLSELQFGLAFLFISAAIISGLLLLYAKNGSHDAGSTIPSLMHYD
jgi:hypothetical protein